MPHLPGLFDSFDNLDAISAESLTKFLKNAPAPVHLENYLANKILYPTSLPMTALEMRIDLAILREALRISGSKKNFLNVFLRKIIIPERFLRYVDNLINLSWAFLDGLFLNKGEGTSDLWTVVLSSDFDEVVGSVLFPQFAALGDRMIISLQDRDYTIQAGSLTLVACPTNKCQISYKFDKGQFLGKQASAVEIRGGRLGLMIDGRNR